jgi:endoglucanase Acf2
MAMKINQEETPPRQRPQYHYFYGSTETSTTGTPPDNPSLSTSTDLDSLVGEALLPTDNEGDDDTTKILDSDLQQTLMTNGESIHLLTGSSHNNGNGNGRRPRPWFRMVSLNRLRENHPLVHVTMLILSLALFMLIFTVVIFPDSQAASVVGTPQTELAFIMPFPKVDRATYNDPVSNFLVKELFHPSLRNDGSDEHSKPSGVFIFPFPTGAFWTNLVLPPTADQHLSYPIAVYPYAFKWSPSLLQISYPTQHRKEDAKSIHDYFFPDLTMGSSEEISERYITHFDALSTTLRYTINRESYWETYLVQGSPYITIKYHKATPSIKAFSIFNDVFCPRGEDNGSSSFDSSPKFSFGICSTSSDDKGHSSSLRGVQFILETQEGMKWIMFASEPISLIFNEREKTTVVSDEAFTGIIRLALIPPPPSTSARTNPAPPQSNVTVFSSSGLQRLIYHADVYPVAGDVSWTFRQAGSSSISSAATKSVQDITKDITGESPSKAPPKAPGRIGTIHFDFTTSTFTPTSSGASSNLKSLLMLGLPHHAAAIAPNAQLSLDHFDLVYRCIKGPLRPVLGSSWSYDEPLPSIGFDEGSGSNPRYMYADPGVRRTILKSLQEDVNLALPTLSENVYGFGKQVARLAQLAHIGSMLQVGNQTQRRTGYATNTTKHSSESSPDDNALEKTINQTLATLSDALEHFLTSNVTDQLVYDANLGGLVTTDGLKDHEADFGNGRYNDHHFHYGYILFACAIMARWDPSFLEKYSQEVDAIFYDVAHNSNFDSKSADGVFFPGSRHKVWFDGHSFASGLFPFGNGKSQESSSEAVNCYYGAYLWSLVRHGAASNPDSDTSTQTDFTRLLLATEIRGARTYWHMVPPSKKSNRTDSDALSTVYSPQFSKNYMVGNLGMLDAVCTTWFGTQSLYVHMINLIPVTAITGELFDRKYVTQEYHHVLEPLKEVEMAWKGFVVADHAIIDAQSSWEEVQEIDSRRLDSGLSKSQLLYWISTRSGFNATKATKVPLARDDGDSSKGGGSPGKSGGGTCNSHPVCAKAGLVGECCPTPEGFSLACCGGI